MSIQNFQSADPFALEGAGTSASTAGGLIHIRLQQRNGRKTLTTVQGLAERYPKHIKGILKQWKKTFNCNGTLIEEKDSHEMIFQLQGNHCDQIKQFLLSEDMVAVSQIKVHGF